MNTTHTLPLRSEVSLVFHMTSLLVLLLAVASVGGLLLGPRGWYDVDAVTFAAFIGQDWITLVFGVPLLGGTAWLTKRGSTRALLCWMGALFYVAYSYSFYVLGARVNPLFPVYMAIVSIGMYGALALLFALDLSALAARVGPQMPISGVSGFLMATALFFAGLWLWVTCTSLVNGLQLDLVTRSVIAIDGVVLLPLLFFGGLWLWQRTPLGFALAGLLLMKAAATFLTLIVNSAVAMSWGQMLDPLQTVAFAVGFAAATVLLVRFLRGIDPVVRAA